MSMNEQYITGLDEQDAQHRYFFTLVDLVESDSVKGNPTALGHVLDEIERHARSHFGCEEALMDAYGYPGEGHRAEHAMLLARVRTMRDDPSFRPTSLRLFLYNWIVNHIDLEDRDFAEFVLKARNDLLARIQAP